jgi:sterol 3beta-glucosyltransferase
VRHSYQSKPTHVDNNRWDPISAGSAVLLSTAKSFTLGFKEIFTGPVNAFAGKGDETHSKGTNAAISVGRGFGKMALALPKATLVDMPLAFTEGFRQMPRLYGDSVRDNGRVTDWISGGAVAGKVFGSTFHFMHELPADGIPTRHSPSAFMMVCREF